MAKVKTFENRSLRILSTERTDDYYTLLLPSTFWTGVTVIDYETNDTELSVKSLLDLCLNKLVSDKFYIRYVSYQLPPLFHSLLLQKAFDEGKTLSIMHLITYYSGQSLTLQIPKNLANWSMFLSNPTQPPYNLKHVISNAIAAIKAFFSSYYSQLHTLDVSQAFIPVPQMESFIPIFENDSSLVETNILYQKTSAPQMKTFIPLVETNSLPQKTYTLKAGLFAINKRDITVIQSFKEASLKNKFIKFDLVGLHICSLEEITPVEKLFDMMDKEELLNFSLDFSSFDLARFLPKLQLFSNLQTLSLSYIYSQNAEPLYFDYLATALNSFVHLKQLCLKGNKLSNLIQKLLKNDCRKIYSSQESNLTNFNCCLIHRGNLEYLDISSCTLRNEDLLVLQEFSFTRSLKYLNLRSNSLNVSSVADLIEKIGPSLVVLEIENCFRHGEPLKEVFRKFCNLLNLKSLNMRDISLDAEETSYLLRALEQMTELRQLAVSKTVFTDISSEDTAASIATY